MPREPRTAVSQITACSSHLRRSIASRCLARSTTACWRRALRQVNVPGYSVAVMSEYSNDLGERTILNNDDATSPADTPSNVRRLDQPSTVTSDRLPAGREPTSQSPLGQPTFAIHRRRAPLACEEGTCD